MTHGAERKRVRKRSSAELFPYATPADMRDTSRHQDRDDPADLTVPVRRDHLTTSVPCISGWKVQWKG